MYSFIVIFLALLGSSSSNIVPETRQNDDTNLGNIHQQNNVRNWAWCANQGCGSGRILFASTSSSV